jgi:hypothetical protein
MIDAVNLYSNKEMGQGHEAHWRFLLVARFGKQLFINSL